MKVNWRVVIVTLAVSLVAVLGVYAVYESSEIAREYNALLPASDEYPYEIRAIGDGTEKYIVKDYQLLGSSILIENYYQEDGFSLGSRYWTLHGGILIIDADAIEITERSEEE